MIAIQQLPEERVAAYTRARSSERTAINESRRQTSSGCDLAELGHISSRAGMLCAIVSAIEHAQNILHPPKYLNILDPGLSIDYLLQRNGAHRLLQLNRNVNS